jgi:hypothetical protein
MPLLQSALTWLCLAVLVWPCLLGRACLAVLAWPCLLGRACLAVLALGLRALLFAGWVAVTTLSQAVSDDLCSFVQ